MYVVRPGAFAGDGEETLALEKTVGPFGDDLVGDAFAAIDAERLIWLWE